MTEAAAVPGFLPALRAVEQARGAGLLTVDEVLTIALAIARPYMQAELLADLADELVEVSPQCAALLDQISHQMREALTP